MNKIFILFLLLIALSFGFAEETAGLRLLKPVDPAIMGRGYTAIADPGGYQAFFHNPAGFAKENQFTILSANPWIFTDRATVELLQNPSAAATMVEEKFTESPTIEAEIQEWVDDQSPTQLQQILSDSGYSETDIIAAGGADAFFDDLTQEEIISIAGIVLQDPDFPIQPTDLGLPSGAARVGTSMGVAFTAGGLGLGVFGIVDANLEGPNILAAEGRAAAQITAHAGYALTLDLGLAQVHAGAQIRPTLLYATQVDASFIPEVMNGGSDVLAAVMNKPGIAAFGAGIDAGVIVDLWWFNIGVSANNILSFMKVQDGVTLNSIVADPLALIPETQPEIVQNLELNFGLGFHPQFGALSLLLDPAIYVDFQDINGVIAAVELAGSDQDAVKAQLLDLVKIGADVKVLNFLRAKAGYAGGYFTLGAGLELPLIKASVAATFGTTDIEDISDFGITAEVALKL